MKLSELLLAYMKQKGLSLRMLAKEIGCHYTTLNRIIHDEPCNVTSLHKVYTWMISPL